MRALFPDIWKWNTLGGPPVKWPPSKYFIMHLKKKKTIGRKTKTISIESCCELNTEWAPSCSQSSDEDVSVPRGSCQLILALGPEPNRGPTPPLLKIEESIRGSQCSSVFLNLTGGGTTRERGPNLPPSQCASWHGRLWGTALVLDGGKDGMCMCCCVWY